MGALKNKKNQRPWARAQCAHWLRRHWTLIVNTARCRRASSSATADTYHQHDFLQDKLPLLHIFRVRDRFLASVALQLIQCEIGHRRADHVRCPISVTKLFVEMTGLENLIMFDLLHSYTIIISLQSSFYYWHSITHSLFHSRLKSFLFCESSLPQPFLSLRQDSLYGFPRLFTATSEHIRLFTF